MGRKILLRNDDRDESPADEAERAEGKARGAYLARNRGPAAAPYKRRESFTDEQMTAVAEAVRDRRLKMKDAADGLGTTETSLRRWIVELGHGDWLPGKGKKKPKKKKAPEEPVRRFGEYAASGYETVERREMQKSSSKAQSICGTCFTHPHLCSWLMSGKPVDGWTAARNDMPMQRKELAIVSYKVFECPLYTDMTKYVGINEDGAKRLMEKIK